MYKFGKGEVHPDYHVKFRINEHGQKEVPSDTVQLCASIESHSNRAGRDKTCFHLF